MGGGGKRFFWGQGLGDGRAKWCFSENINRKRQRWILPVKKHYGGGGKFCAHHEYAGAQNTRISFLLFRDRVYVHDNTAGSRVLFIVLLSRSGVEISVKKKTPSERTTEIFMNCRIKKRRAPDAGNASDSAERFSAHCTGTRRACAISKVRLHPCAFPLRFSIQLAFRRSFPLSPCARLCRML